MSQTTTNGARRIVPTDESGNELANFPMLANGQAMQRVKTEYTTAIAVQQPRVLTRVEKMAMEESALLGSDAFYGWGAGKDSVEGPSVGLAMSLCRCWGNCAVDMGEVQDLPDAWIFTAKFVDLETGYTLTRQFRQSKKWVVHGKFDEARKDDIRFQIGQSKAVRNVVLNAVPKWLTRRALDKAKGGVREAIEEAIKIHGMEKVVVKAVSRLADLGVDEARILAAMGRKAVAALTVEDLVILRGNIAALESGADDIDGVFPVKVSNHEGLRVDTGVADVDGRNRDLAARVAAKQQAEHDAARSAQTEPPKDPPASEPKPATRKGPKPEPKTGPLGEDDLTF